MTSFQQSFAVIKASIKNTLAYRFNFFVEMILMPLVLAVYYVLWKSIYSYSGQEIIRGYTLHMLISYYVIEMITSIIIWSKTDADLARQVRKGKMHQVLLRPMGYIPRALSGAVGGKLIGLLFNAIPIFLIGFVFFGVAVSWSTLLFIPVVILAYLINFFLVFITGLGAFWLKENRGLVSIREIIVEFISGGTLPLTFFPLWFQSMSWFLPFQYSRFIPINVFLGMYDVQTVLFLMVIQIFWIIVLYIIAKIIWHYGAKRYTGVGQ